MSQRSVSAIRATRTPVGGRRGVVSAGTTHAVEAALDVYEAGGNAVDAAVAAAFVSFVAEPNNAGIAGYGHLSAFVDGTFVTVDHGPRAPGAARADLFALAGPEPEGHDWPDVRDDANAIGPLAVAVPGAVAGLHAIHARAGRRPWAELLEPAITLADAGLEVTWFLLLLLAGRLEAIRASPALAAILLPEGRLPRARTEDEPGERLDQHELAATLRRVAQEGPDGFYRGPVAEAIADAVADNGILTAGDLAGYVPKVLEEAPAHFRGWAYVTANDQVGTETLNLLDTFPAASAPPGSATHYHRLAEAMGHAFVDNLTHAGDPDHVDSPLQGLASPAFARARAKGLRDDGVAPRPVAPADPWPFEGRPGPTPPPSVGGARGTTQVVTADAEGTVVALITTIGDDFGALLAVPGTGVILNNSMMNYDPRPGRANSIAPGKMPFFAVPAVVASHADGRRFAAAGSGGYPILAGVVSATVGHLEHGLPVQAAIDAPRVHSQGAATYVDAAIVPAVRDELAALGHELVVQEVTPGELPFSRVGAVSVAADGTLDAGSGPAWTTAAGGT